MSELHFRATRALLCTIALSLVTGQGFTSELFEAVLSSGVPKCSADPTFLTQRARSSIECSLRCLALSADGGCVAFNFKQDTLSCELFNALSGVNYANVAGCALYKVGLIP